MTDTDAETAPPPGDETGNDANATGATGDANTTTDGPPTTTRDGARIYIHAPFDSPYAMRLRRFGAHWDQISSRWWVGVVKAKELDALLVLPLGHLLDEPPDVSQAGQPASKLLVDMACEDYTLGVTETGEPYGIHRDTPHLALMLRGGRTGLRAALAERFFDANGVPAPQQAIADACLVLEGRAAKETPRPVHLRVATGGENHIYGCGQVYIDMGDPEGHVIRIVDGRWEVAKGIELFGTLNAPPVLFRRTRLTGEIPKPRDGGDYTRLWKFVPINGEDQPLVLAFLVQGLIQANTSHPVLELRAEHGSVKSGSAKRLTLLIDPSPAPLRKVPREAEGWVTAANASWVVALDNVSGEIPLWLSDCLCRAVTGEGDVRRALYTDSDVSVIAFRRVVIINGIDIEITQGDLADRLLRVPLPRVQKRLKEDDVEADWAKEWPHILGGLLTLAAQVHHRLPDTEVTDLPRMADYAAVLAAVDAELAVADPEHGTKGLDRYREQAKRVGADTLDTPFIATLVDRGYCCENAPAKQILDELTAKIRPAGEKNWKPPKDWPTRATAVSGQLNRHGPALRSEGWVIENDGGHNKDGHLLWTITAPEMACETPPPPPPPPPEDDNNCSDIVFDGGDTGGDADWWDTETSPPPWWAENGGDGAETPENASPPENRSPTSGDGEAEQAEHKYNQSLVHCKNCGDPIPETAPVAQALGYCHKSRCMAAANERDMTPPF